MIPESFDYQRAGSVREALTLLKQHGENAKVLAGGHSLIPTMKLRLANPGTLIDIGGISELKYINDKGDYLAIGAGTTHWMVETSSLVQQKAPALSQAAGQIGDVQVRNRGTIGGVLAHSDPQADYPGVVLALKPPLLLKDLEENAQLRQLIISPVFGKLHLVRMKFLLKSGFPWTVLMPIHAISSSHSLHPAIHMWAAQWLWTIPEEIVLKSELVSAELLNPLFVTAELKMQSGDRH